MDNDRLERVIDELKSEFYATGAEYKETNDKALIGDLKALTSAVNVIEVHLYNKRVTVITDSIG